MVTLYTTHCPKCRVIEKKLEQKNIPYETLEDVEEIIELGFRTVPILKVDDNTYLNFTEANNWIKEQN